MSNKFEYGLNRALVEIVEGLITSIVISSFVSAGLFPSYFILFFHVLSAIGMIVLIQKMPYWATNYIFGWLFGVIILATSGLLVIPEILIYLIPLGFLVNRYRKK